MLVEPNRLTVPLRRSAGSPSGPKPDSLQRIRVVGGREHLLRLLLWCCRLPRAASEVIQSWQHLKSVGPDSFFFSFPRERMALEVGTWQPLQYQLSPEALPIVSLTITPPCAGLLLRVVFRELLPSAYLFPEAMAPCPHVSPPRNLPACSLRAPAALLLAPWEQRLGARRRVRVAALGSEMFFGLRLPSVPPLTVGLSSGAGILDTAIVDRGRNVLSCSRDGTARLWDCGQSACLAVVADCGSPVNGIAVGAADNSVNLGAPEKTPSEELSLKSIFIPLSFWVFSCLVSQVQFRGHGVLPRALVRVVRGARSGPGEELSLIKQLE